MRAFRIPKTRNRFRVVHACTTRTERRRYRRLARSLAKWERRASVAAGTEMVAHGFIRGRNPVTGATLHIGATVTISMDLSDWYDHVQEGQIAEALRLAGCPQPRIDTALAAACMVSLDSAAPRSGCPAPRQGLASSPAAANLAGVLFDRALLDALTHSPCRAVYTRYADDITISLFGSVSPADITMVREMVMATAARFAWPVSERKTRVQWARKGRRVILGLSVGEQDVRATRKLRRRLRAALHQNPDSAHTRSLAEWAACKLPNTHARRQAYALAASILSSSEDPVVTLVAADALEDAGLISAANWLRSGPTRQLAIHAMRVRS